MPMLYTIFGVVEWGCLANRKLTKVLMLVDSCRHLLVDNKLVRLFGCHEMRPANVG